MNRFNSIKPNRTLGPIEHHDNLCEIESTSYVKLSLWVSLIDQFKSIKGLG